MYTFLTRLYRRSRSGFLVFVSMSAFWCWLNIFIFNFDTSPLNDLLPLSGAKAEVAQLVFCCVAAAGVCGQLFLMDEQSNRSAAPWFLCGWILSSLMLAFAHGTWVYYALVAAMGLFSGLILCRLMLLSIFLLPREDAARIVIVLFAVTNVPFMLLRIHFFGRVTWINYAIITAIQGVCALAFLSAEPDVVHVRAQIPDRKLSFREVALLALLMGGIYFCMAGVKNVARPSFDQTPHVYLYQILPNILTIVVYFLWLYRMKLMGNLVCFLLLLGFSLATFQVFGGSSAGRIAFETFMEPANYFIDVFFFVIMARLIYAYGRRAFRVRILASIVTVIIGGFYGISALFFTPDVQLSFYTVYYVVIMALLAALPTLERTLPFLFAQTYVISEQMPSAEQSTYAQAISDIRAALPVPDSLTAREREVFSLLAQGQDNDIIAGLLSISKSTLGKHISSIYGKLGVRNRRELLAEANGASSFSENGDLLLTRRELEIKALRQEGLSDVEIAGRLTISIKTVRVHLYNIAQKQQGVHIAK